MSFFSARAPVALNLAAGRFGTRRLDYIEIDILLTHLLQRMHEMGLMDHLVFKGGTMLRKMVFGPGGRLSTDLDFVVRSADGLTPDDLALEIASVFQEDYRAIRFAFNLDKDVGTSEGSCRANPRCMTNFTPSGHVIKIEVSFRADPILPPEVLPQIAQPYFADLDFVPAAIPSLRLEEAIAEKIRAAFQRAKIRDLHDLQQSKRHGFDPDLVRSLAVSKIWESPGGLAGFEPFSHQTFVRRMNDRMQTGAYEESDLQDLLRNTQRVDLNLMVKDVSETYSFLKHLTAEQATLATDRHRREQELGRGVRNKLQAAFAVETSMVATTGKGP